MSAAILPRDAAVRLLLDDLVDDLKQLSARLECYLVASGLPTRTSGWIGDGSWADDGMLYNRSRRSPPYAAAGVALRLELARAALRGLRRLLAAPEIDPEEAILRARQGGSVANEATEELLLRSVQMRASALRANRLRAARTDANLEKRDMRILELARRMQSRNSRLSESAIASRIAADWTEDPSLREFRQVSAERIRKILREGGLQRTRPRRRRRPN